MSRTKEQWLRETGGFRFGETPEQFEARSEEIERISRRIADGSFTPDDIDRLAELRGTEDDE